MKKLIAVIMSVAMILSLSALMANAVELVGDNGTVAIEWDADAADKITLDGDISEWADEGYVPTRIGVENMYAWSGADLHAESSFALNTYFVADSDWLYVAFFIADSNWVKSTNDTTTVGYYGNADSFQIAIDFNGFMEDSYNTGYDDFQNSVFYSFACHNEGDALVFARQNCGPNGDAVLSEASGDGVKGVADAYEGGWCAEFAISWEQMYQDLELKTAEGYIAPFDANNDFKLGILLCYLDHQNVDGTVSRNWMAGTTKSDACNWAPQDSGLYPTLEWAPDRYLNCTGVENAEVGSGDETTTEPADETTEPADETTTEPADETTTEPADETTTEPVDETTEPADETTTEPVDETTEPVDETTTEPADETTEPADETTTAADTTAADTTAAAEGGCGSVIGAGAAAIVLAAIAAGVALSKKH
ncbi:MAG: hypothetical protein IJX74_05770 [Clostridia bacterium]|nr:hypothetical protein [Clostridia bacterium]